MEQIKTITLRKAISLLDACGFKYVIIDSDGKKHGTLEVVDNTKKRKLEYPMGTLVSYIVKHIPVTIAVGDVFQIPPGNFDPVKIRSGAISYLIRKYGTGKFTSIVTDGMPEFMRLED
jgi:hypothetical protein